jgi:phage terminase large subunit-like protein
MAHVADANRYARAVVAGKIQVSRWVRLACQRHLDDLKREKTKAFHYRFDKAKAERACGLIELLPHTKGKWAASGGTIRLEPWQKFIVCSIFGWVRKVTGLRRFRKAYLEIPRKNGKSALAAGIAIVMFAFDDEYRAEIYFGAGSRKQANEVFVPAKTMIAKTPKLKACIGADIWADKIVLPADNSIMEPVIGKPGDGASPSCAIADEFHEHQTADLVETMETGMGSREQPLLLEITTAGFDISSPCHEQHMECRMVLEGVMQNDTLFCAMYGIDDADDWTDPAILRKANPNFGISIEPEFLLSQQRLAIQNPAHATSFKTKHLNVWCSAREGMVNMVRWHAGVDLTVKREDMAGSDCVFAIDLASKTDLCAYMQIFRREVDGKPHYWVFGRYYLPEDTIENDKHNAAAYRKWVLQGWLTQTDGATVDFDWLLADLLHDAAQYQPSEMVYDPMNATWLAQKVEEEGVQAVEFPQNAANMGPATDEFVSAIHDYRVHHDGNPITAWCISNLVARRGGKLPCPTKQKPQYKIDGAIAAIMGVQRLVAGSPESVTSIYEQGVGI